MYDTNSTLQWIDNHIAVDSRDHRVTLADLAKDFDRHGLHYHWWEVPGGMYQVGSRAILFYLCHLKEQLVHCDLHTFFCDRSMPPTRQVLASSLISCLATRAEILHLGMPISSCTVSGESWQLFLIAATFWIPRIRIQNTN